ncbi:GtrA family protein [Sandarakinorhabdus sp. DWP1-3-1]|uniref:GtrA family protein n=1 Tax=Sandarakinorhabdus sp. DWP1-3-1 TaxID=2804627 RepID=UPI003CEF780D
MTAPERTPSNGIRGQVLRFLLVGGSAAAVDFGVLALGIHLGGSRYASRIASVAVAIVYTWWLNRRLTFATAAPPSWQEFGQYVLVTLAGSLLNLALYSAALWLGAPLWLAFVIGTGTAAVFNFVRYRAMFGKGERPAD